MLARRTIARAFHRTSDRMRWSRTSSCGSSRSSLSGGMVFRYGVVALYGTGAPLRRASSITSSSRKNARSAPSNVITESSASTHSRVSAGSRSSSMGIPSSTAHTRAAPEPAAPSSSHQWRQSGMCPKLGGDLFVGEVLIVGCNVQDDAAGSGKLHPRVVARRGQVSVSQPITTIAVRVRGRGDPFAPRARFRRGRRAGELPGDEAGSARSARDHPGARLGTKLAAGIAPSRAQGTRS